MEAALVRPLCTRTVCALVQQKKVVAEISLYAPCFDEVQYNWWCIVRVTGIGLYLNPACEEWRLGGVDGFGAVENALEHIPRILESTGIQWAWGPDPGPTQPPDGLRWHGFSRAIAPSMPVTFQRKMKVLVDAETEAAIGNGDMRRYAKSELRKT